MEQRVWILGASDPEMEAIERLLRECEETVVYATGAQGRRVHPGNAYNASVREITADVVYEIECRVAHRARLRAEKCVTVDHHRVGDPGYGKPPVDFLSASSIGQVISELARLGRLPASWGCAGPARATVGRYGRGRGRGSAYTVSAASCNGEAALAVVVPCELVLTAAADHCLGAAYARQCPGVDPDALMAWRAASRARFQRRTVKEVLADVETASALLRERLNRDVLWLDPGYNVCTCVDMRSDLPIPELPEAAARLGIGYVSGPLIGPDGRKRYTCSGSAEQVRAFLDCWAPKEGLVGLYGDPARGFAGGYVRGSAQKV